jgi:hypothetical protein
MLQKYNFTKLGNRRLTSIALPPKSATDDMEEIT